MELKDICSLTYSFDDLQPFCMQSTENGTFSIVTKNCVQILTPQFNFSMDLNRFNFKVSRIKCPQSCTTGLIDARGPEIYASATLSEKQDILTDQRFLPKMSDGLIQSRAVSWSPKNPKGTNYLAYLSNYGGLEIFTESDDGTWIACLNIGTYWFSELVKNHTFPVNNFSDLNKLVQEILFSTLCWDEGCKGQYKQRLLCSTKCNKLVLFSLELDFDRYGTGKVVVQKIVDIKQKHVTALKWIHKDNGEAFVIAGSLDGKICLYTIATSGEICLKATLWEEEDQLAIGKIEFIPLKDHLLIIAAKGAYLLFFLFKDTRKISEAVELIPGYSITGLLTLSSTKLLVTSLEGTSYTIDVEIKSNEIKVKPEKIVYKFNLSKYSVYGVGASPNKAYFILASFATHPNDHLILRQPANFVICRSITENPLQTLIKSPLSTIYDMMDYAEVVRFTGGKDMSVLRQLEAQLDLETNVGLTDEFLSHLRAAIVVNAARYSYFRLRSTEETKSSRLNAEVLYKFVEVIRAHQVLDQLIQELPQIPLWTEGQIRAGRALLTFLEQFATDETILDTTQLQTIHSKLTPLISSVIKRGKFLYEIKAELEICTICDQPQPINELVCNEGHKTPRCSISKLQFSTLSPPACPHCTHCVLEDRSLLREVTLNKPNLLTCPLCNVPLVK